MREIKFRAFWDKWDSMYLFDIYNVPNLHEKAVIMQYTGLKDKNGKEIYEGDILNYEYEYGKFCIADVYFEERTGLYRISKQINKHQAINHILGLVSICRNMEIIGNIYENPELLINK